MKCPVCKFNDNECNLDFIKIEGNITFPYQNYWNNEKFEAMGMYACPKCGAVILKHWMIENY
jgi:hypothetical protein